jgi:hypothetical protein
VAKLNFRHAHVPSIVIQSEILPFEIKPVSVKSPPCVPDFAEYITTGFHRSARRRSRRQARCRRRTAAPFGARPRYTTRSGGARRSTCRRAPAPMLRRARRDGARAVRNACSSGCPVPRSVASETAPTTSAGRIGRSLEGSATATAPRQCVLTSGSYPDSTIKRSGQPLAWRGCPHEG